MPPPLHLPAREVVAGFPEHLTFAPSKRRKLARGAVEAAIWLAGKPAGVRCLHLDENHLCGLFGRPERPAVCGQFGADPEICGDSREQALALIAEWEVITAA